MNFVLVTLGSHGDVNPFVGLGKTLKGRGHRVLIAANGYFESLARAVGLEFFPLGSAQDYEELARDPRLWHPRKALPYLARYGILPSLKPVYDLLAAELRARPDSVAAASILSSFGAQVAREALPIKLATVHLQPVAYRSIYGQVRFPELSLPSWIPPFVKSGLFSFLDWALIDRLLGPGVNSFRREKGLGPARHFFGTGSHSPDLDIALFPDWFAPRQRDWPQNLVQTGFPVYDGEKAATWPEDLERFLSEGLPPLVFTFGTAMRGGDKLFAAAAEACARLQKRGILLNSDAAQIPKNLPQGVIHLPYASLQKLLPRAAALVHHGGIGSMARAFTTGLPQIAVTMSHDQPDNAGRMMLLGCGLELPRKRASGPRLASLLKRVLEEPSFKTQALNVAEMAKPSKDAFVSAAEALEALARL